MQEWADKFRVVNWHVADWKIKEIIWDAEANPHDYGLPDEWRYAIERNRVQEVERQWAQAHDDAIRNYIKDNVDNLTNDDLPAGC